MISGASLRVCCSCSIFKAHSLLLGDALNNIRLSLLNACEHLTARFKLRILLIGEQVLISGLSLYYFLGGDAGGHASDRALIKKSSINACTLLISAIDYWVIFALLAQDL